MGTGIIVFQWPIIFEPIVLAFVLWRAFVVTIVSTFGIRKVSARERRTTILLSWERQRFDIDFQEFRHGFDQATVKDLKAKCKEVTSIPISTMRLKVSGGEEGKPWPEEEVQQTVSGNPEEYGLIVRISKVLDQLNTDIPDDIRGFEEMLTKGKDGETLTEVEKKKLQDKGVYLSEKLMLALITLDAVECPIEFETARQQRKQGVKRVQQLLDHVDGIRANVRKLI
ncbi:hypothetical protein EC973_006177 [Apophysomyces ossiformis]|uniref:BAG domain-containing protein n=1 Tax=Apophysomyces ossiformis TaxID=679940 RepID=A0A8H7BQX8_9FUNG|nr:hypothetical protein EC973_006177 [Apophysomyces ossiformis]